MGDSININQASIETLESLKGIGRAKAKAIVNTRQRLPNKIFSCIEDLLLAPGIGQSFLDQNKERIYCSTNISKPRRLLGRRTKSGPGNYRRAMIHCSHEEKAKRPEKNWRSMEESNHNGLYEGDSDGEDDALSSIVDKLEQNSDIEDSSISSRKSGSRERKLGVRLRNNKHLSGSDTPHEEGAPEIDVPLSPMRITDEEICSADDFAINSSDEAMCVETVNVPDKKQNKRKSELCVESKVLCPVKKSCKAVESNECLKLSPNSLRLSPPPSLGAWLSKFQSWPMTQKLVALDSLVNILDLAQVRHIHQTILPQFQRDFISLLPKELALYVLSYLEPRDLLMAAQTCKYWNALTSDNLLWKMKCIEAGLDLPMLKEEVNFECSQKENCSSKESKKKKQEISFGHMSPFKAAFMRQHRIEMNWRVKPLKPPLVLKGHDDHVITCLQFSNNTIVSGSDDNTLRVWDATTGKVERHLLGHTGGVWSSQMCNDFVVSGSTDRMLRVWNAQTGECIHVLYGHTSTVRCLHLHDKKVVSGSRDATLRVWDVITGECDHVLVGHVAAVRCVQYNGKLVVSGAYDYLVKVWNPATEECLHTLQGHSNRVYSLQFDGVHVVSGSLDTSIRVWDVETGQCRHTLMGHQSLTSGMELKDNILISGNADSTVKVWDIITGQCLQTLSGPNKHRSAVTCLQFNKKFVITSSDDGTVKLWDVKTGEFIRNLVVLDSGGSGGVVWRIRASETKLVCAVGSRNGTEETKLLVLDFDAK